MDEMEYVTSPSPTAVNSTASSTTTEAPLPTFHSLPYKTVGVLLVSLIFLVGFVGNIMVVVVVRRTRSLHTPTNCYLVSLAVADLLLLVSAPLPTLVEFFLVMNHSGWLGRPGCVTMVFCQYLSVNVSALSMTFFTVERYIAICHPMRAQIMCTVNRAKRIIVALWVFGVCYCAPWLGLVTTGRVVYRDGSVSEWCDFKLKRDSYRVYYMADLVIFYVVPLVVTCLLYSLIGHVLYTSTLSSAPAASTLTNGAASNHAHSAGRQTSRIKVINMLALVVCLFAVFWMPYRVFVVYNSFTKKPFQNTWFMLFCRVMIYMNSAVNPVLYNAMSVKFRRAFRRQLCCRSKSPVAARVNYTQVTRHSSHHHRPRKPDPLVTTTHNL